MKTYQIIYYSLLASGVLLAGFRFRKLNPSSRWSSLLLVVTLISELCAHFYPYAASNFPVYHFFIPIQFTLVCSAYLSEMRLPFGYLIIVGFAGFCLVAALTFQPLRTFPSITNITGSLLVIIIALIYLKKLLQEAREHSFVQFPLFWISFGWLFFNVLTLFHFGVYNYLLTNQSDFTYQVLRNMRIGSNFVLYLCYLMSFVTSQQSLGSTHSGHGKHGW